jgi:hypothetical protein
MKLPNKEILDFDDIRAVSRLGDRATLATVERWANKIGLLYSYDGVGGIWTTVDAMNAAVGLISAPQRADKYTPESVI